MAGQPLDETTAVGYVAQGPRVREAISVSPPGRQDLFDRAAEVADLGTAEALLPVLGHCCTLGGREIPNPLASTVQN
jgi:hypothetical protein